MLGKHAHHYVHLKDSPKKWTIWFMFHHIFKVSTSFEWWLLMYIHHSYTICSWTKCMRGKHGQHYVHLKDSPKNGPFDSCSIRHSKYWPPLSGDCWRTSTIHTQFLAKPLNLLISTCMKQNSTSTFLLVMDALDKRRIFGPYEGISNCNGS